MYVCMYVCTAVQLYKYVHVVRTRGLEVGAQSKKQPAAGFNLFCFALPASAAPPPLRQCFEPPFVWILLLTADRQHVARAILTDQRSKVFTCAPRSAGVASCPVHRRARHRALQLHAQPARAQGVLATCRQRSRRVLVDAPTRLLHVAHLVVAPPWMSPRWPLPAAVPTMPERRRSISTPTTHVERCVGRCPYSMAMRQLRQPRSLHPRAATSALSSPLLVLPPTDAAPTALVCSTIRQWH